MPVYSSMMFSSPVRCIMDCNMSGMWGCSFRFHFFGRFRIPLYSAWSTCNTSQCPHGLFPSLLLSSPLEGATAAHYLFCTRLLCGWLKRETARLRQFNPVYSKDAAKVTSWLYLICCLYPHGPGLLMTQERTGCFHEICCKFTSWPQGDIEP